MDLLAERGLSPADFYVERNGLVFGAMLKLYEESAPIDEVTVAQQLKDLGTWDRSGGVQTIADLLERAGTTAHLDRYVVIVLEKARIRALVEAARAIEMDALAPVDDVDALLSGADARLRSVLEVSSGDRQTSFDGAELAKVAMAPEGARIMRPTRAAHLFAPVGQPTVLAGPTGSGKSGVCTTMAAKQADEGQRVAFFSLELTAQENVHRIFAARMRCPFAAVQKALRDQADATIRMNGTWVCEYAAVTAQADRLAQQKFWVDDTAGITWQKIDARSRSLAKRWGGLDLVIVDYLQLLGWTGYSKANQNSKLEEQLEAMRRLAKDLGCMMVLVSQFNRVEPGKAPEMSNLRGSGAIEQAAGMVVFTSHHGDKSGFRIVKGRYTGPMWVPAKYFGPCYLWEDV
jgi:replicative DNA helicase